MNLQTQCVKISVFSCLGTMIVQHCTASSSLYHPLMPFMSCMNTSFVLFVGKIMNIVVLKMNNQYANSTMVVLFVTCYEKTDHLQ